LRAALDWASDANPSGYARLAGSLHEFWDIRGHFAEGFGRLEHALVLHASDDPVRLHALLGCAALAYRLDHRDRSDALLEATIASARRLSDTRREAEALLWRARDLDFQGPDVLEPLAQSAYALSQSIDHPWGTGLATWIFGRVATMRGDPTNAQRLFLESAAHFDRGGSVLMAAMARTWAGQCAIDRLDFDSARILLEAALAEHRRLGNVHEEATTLRSIGQLDLNTGRLADARRASEESSRMFRALHDLNCGALTTSVLAEVLHASGDHALSLRHANEAANVAAKLGFHHSRAGAMWLAGRNLEANGNPKAARDAYFEGLREVMQATQRAHLPGLLEAIAGMHPDAAAAPRLLGAAAAMREARGSAVFPSEHADVDRWHASVRAGHASAFEREFESGRAITCDDAVAVTLSFERRG
jgi:tetratricopeptide (TPR) repeat protein